MRNTCAPRICKSCSDPTVFEKYVYLDTGADKDEELEAYRDTGCLWVEDKVENAIAGAKVGLESVVMSHGYNQDCDFPS